MNRQKAERMHLIIVGNDSLHRNLPTPSFRPDRTQSYLCGRLTIKNFDDEQLVIDWSNITVGLCGKMYKGTE